MLDGALARIGELSRVEVCQHNWRQWQIVYHVRDPERGNCLMVLSTIDRHLHHPIGGRDDLSAMIHDLRFDSIQQSKFDREM